jgi:hypothetical protein
LSGLNNLTRLKTRATRALNAWKKGSWRLVAGGISHEGGETDTPESCMSLAFEAETPCTKVQVFHRQDRENEAKTMAKVKAY